MCVVAVSGDSGVGDPKFENRHSFFNFYFFLKFLQVCVSVLSIVAVPVSVRHLEGERKKFRKKNRPNRSSVYFTAYVFLKKSFENMRFVK